MKASRRKITVIAIAGAVGVYLLSYLVLAFSGGYTFAASGQFRPINHLASVDTMVWQPRVGTFYPFRNASGHDVYQSDWIGRIYSPLILLYRNFAAPTIRSVDSSGKVRESGVSLPRRNQLHPLMKRELPALEQNFGLTWEQIVEKLAAGRGIFE
jgi:hypothetical protein